MNSKRIRVCINSEIKNELQWTFGIFADYIGFEVEFTRENYELSIGENGLGDIELSHFFRNAFTHGDYNFKSYFSKEPLHFTASNKPDYLSTCFYLLSCLQEYADYTPDTYGRFPYKASLQKYFSCVHVNLVANYFDKLFDSTPKLKNSVSKKINPSKFFLTHDIDSLYGALGNNYKYLLKRGSVAKLLQLILNHYVYRPDYMLLDKIMKMEDEHDVRSTFFWIVNKGKVRLQTNRRVEIENADYSLHDEKVKVLLKDIQQRGFANGLHKSVSGESYADELYKLHDAALPVNRNHYLKINLPQSFDKMEKANIKIDTSLGFAEEYGFRNNYGLYFKPYNLKQKRAYDFTEIPLTVMDTTCKHYLKLSAAKSEKEILNFLEGNKQNAIVTVLWHNNYFFNYADAGWIDCYKSILAFITENNLSCITPQEIISAYQD